MRPVRIGLMGVGRIGRNLFRILYDSPDIEIAAIEEPADHEAIEYLMRFDTILGPFPDELSIREGNLYVVGRQIPMFNSVGSETPNWGDLGVDIVIDASGRQRSRAEQEAHLDKGAKRNWSDSYLALTQNGRPNELVRWLNVQSIPPMLPPYFAGSARSELISMLRAGHHGVTLSREEMDKLCCWIDLLVPYCGDYREANAWTDAEKAKYEKFLDKRRKMEAVERANIEALMKR